MIRIARGAEPVELTNARHLRLAEALVGRERNGGDLPADFDFGGYEVARPWLYRAQNRKCAYCERQMGEKEQPREHFRPKDGAQRHRSARSGDGAGNWDTDCYWWLAWTWENLFFACKTCNGTSHKGNFFPIKGAALPVLEFDLTLEVGGIVDPSREDPLDHIGWSPLQPDEPWERWGWTPKPIGPKGDDTLDAIRFLELDILEQINDTLQKEVVPEVMEVVDLLRSAQVQQATDRWDKLLSRTLYAGAQFSGAKWCALTWLHQCQTLPLAGLPAPPRPGRHDPWVVPSGLPPAPAGIPEAAWYRLLAGQDEDEALRLILQTAPLTVNSLWALLRGTASTYTPTKPKLKAKLDSLCVAGLLDEQQGWYSAR